MNHLDPFQINESLREFYIEFRSMKSALREYGPEDQDSEIEELIKKHNLSKEDLEAIIARGNEFVDHFRFYLDNYPEPSVWDALIGEFSSTIFQLRKTDPAYKRFVNYLSSKYEIKKKNSNS